MIIDEITELERMYFLEFQGTAKVCNLSPDHYAQLREELGLRFDDNLDYYHGMYLEISDYHDEIELDVF